MTETVPTYVNGRWSINLPPHRAERPQWLIENGGWETERLDSMHTHLGRGDVIYDVGSEEGDLTGLYALWGCDVVMWEPNPRVWPNSRLIFHDNGLRWPLACVVGFAADDALRSDPGIGDGVHVGEWPDCAYGPVIGDHGFSNLCERPDIPRCSIDRMATLVDPPTAVTVDVEGSELHVMRSAERVLREHRPLVWVSVHEEFMDRMYGHTPEDLHAFMASCGYTGEHLATDHEAHWLYRPER